uniref:WSSV128 n=1 Tax=White spot syndrome virus TaxID=342409 RepID=A0A3G5BHX2_9VIRU|nr:wssv176 [White spot syndrome virus]AYV99436.1 WSSV128 [White spot syndrome virus]WOG35200.1 late cornified envelope [White spot syndrome virus]
MEAVAVSDDLVSKTFVTLEEISPSLNSSASLASIIIIFNVYNKNN